MEIYIYGLLILNAIFAGLSLYFYLQYRKAKKFFDKHIEAIKERGSLPKEFKELRRFPRIPVPPDDPVRVLFRKSPLRGHQAVVDNISVGGMAFIPKFPLHKITIDQVLEGFDLEFSDGVYRVDRAKVVRISHLGTDKIVAIKWLQLPPTTKKKIYSYVEKYKKKFALQ